MTEAKPKVDNMAFKPFYMFDLGIHGPDNKPPPPLEFVLSPRSSDCEVWPPYWSQTGPRWKEIFQVYGHSEIQNTLDAGCTEPWVFDAYQTWLKRNDYSHLMEV